MNTNIDVLDARKLKIVQREAVNSTCIFKKQRMRWYCNHKPSKFSVVVEAGVGFLTLYGQKYHWYVLVASLAVVLK